MKVQLTICSNRGIDPRFVLNLLGICLTKIPDIQLSVKIGMEGAIDECRDLEATRFLDTDQDYFFFLDDDVLCNPEDIRQLVKDAEEKQSIVIGAYRQKITGDRMALKLLDGEESLGFGTEGSMREIRWGATGFMCIPRQVLVDMAETMPRLNPGTGHELYPFFLPYIYNGMRLSEDFAFCQRARDLGYTIWCDTRIILGHIGTTIYTL